MIRLQEKLVGYLELRLLLEEVCLSKLAVLMSIFLCMQKMLT